MTSTLMTSFVPDVAWKMTSQSYHNIIFIILKVWKSYFPHQKLIRDMIVVFLSLVSLQNSNSAKMISCWYCTSAKMISLFDIIFALSMKVWFFSDKLTKKGAYETKRNKNIYSYIIKGLLHWYRWILSFVGISTDARKLASFDIPTRDNIHRYQCNNPIV